MFIGVLQQPRQFYKTGLKEWRCPKNGSFYETIENKTEPSYI